MRCRIIVIHFSVDFHIPPTMGTMVGPLEDPDEVVVVVVVDALDVTVVVLVGIGLLDVVLVVVALLVVVVVDPPALTGRHWE